MIDAIVFYNEPTSSMLALTLPSLSEQMQATLDIKQ